MWLGDQIPVKSISVFMELPTPLIPVASLFSITLRNKLFPVTAVIMQLTALIVQMCGEVKEDIFHISAFLRTNLGCVTDSRNTLEDKLTCS